MNNDRTVMCKPYAWKVLGILPVLKASAFTNQDEEWQKQRQLRLYHGSMDYVIADENELCKEGRYFRFADKKVRFVKFVHFFTSMDGLELAASALTSTRDCPTCECPRELLGTTSRLYPIRDTQKLRNAVAKARAELLNPDESIKCRCIDKVDISCMISYMIGSPASIDGLSRGPLL